LDAVITATNLQPVLEKQFGANVDQMKAAMQRQFSFLFDVDEEFEQKEFEGTIPQALLLLNGGLTNRGVSPIPGTALSDVMAMAGGDESRIDSLYLRALSRLPTPAERARWSAFVNAPRDAVVTQAGAPAPPPNRPGRRLLAGQKPGKAYEDLFWALLNCSEFMFNH
jgi:hypothetical protein